MAFVAYARAMATNLTIPDLEESVAQRLQQQAARHGRTVEAEAREILMVAVASLGQEAPAPVEKNGSNICDAVRGLWEGRGTTEEMMRELRGEE